MGEGEFNCTVHQIDSQKVLPADNINMTYCLYGDRIPPKMSRHLASLSLGRRAFK